MPEYTLVAAAAFGIAAIAALWQGLHRRRLVWVGLMIFAALTITADVVLTRIGVYGHGAAFASGIRIDRMPIEDLLYGLALYLVAVTTWSWGEHHG